MGDVQLAILWPLSLPIVKYLDSAKLNKFWVFRTFLLSYPEFQNIGKIYSHYEFKMY